MFEVCLLIDALGKTGRAEEARRLGEYLRTQKEAYDNVDVERDNKIFDIVLNLNMLKVNPGGRGGGGAADLLDGATD